MDGKETSLKAYPYLGLSSISNVIPHEKILISGLSVNFLLAIRKNQRGIHFVDLTIVRECFKREILGSLKMVKISGSG